MDFRNIGKDLSTGMNQRAKIGSLFPKKISLSSLLRASVWYNTFLVEWPEKTVCDIRQGQSQKAGGAGRNASLLKKTLCALKGRENMTHRQSNFLGLRGVIFKATGWFQKAIEIPQASSKARVLTS